MQALKDFINTKCQGLEAWQVARNTLAVCALAYYTNRAAKSVRRQGFKRAFLSVAIAAAGHVAPGVVAKEKESVQKEIEHSLLGEAKFGDLDNPVLPVRGIPVDVLSTQLEKWKEFEEKKWKRGQVSGGIYHGGDELLQFMVKIYGWFALSNPLHPEVFPYIRKMESEVVSMCVALFNGRRELGHCGAMTSGGTESIMMAMKAYRDEARTRGIESPEVICATSAHAAFDKSAHYFAFKLVHVPVDPETFRLDIAALKKAINRNTVAIVGSAITFPHGVVDPIPEMSAIAVEHKIGLHVDCCLGSLLIPFMEKLDRKIPQFDFRLRGVSSISADTHKYGYSPKGSSVVLFNSPKLRSHMYFVAPDWSGGIYATPAAPGSRPGGIIAATWAALVANGESGYLKCAQAIMTATDEIKAGINAMPELVILGKPDMSVIAFAARDPSKLNIYAVNTAMGRREWNLNTLQRPAAIHICCTFMHAGTLKGSGADFKDLPAETTIARKFLLDLRASIDVVLASPKEYSKGSAAIYGLAASMPSENVVEVAHTFLDTLYKIHAPAPSAPASSSAAPAAAAPPAAQD